MITNRIEGVFVAAGNKRRDQAFGPLEIEHFEAERLRFRDLRVRLRFGEEITFGGIDHPAAPASVVCLQ